MTCYSIWTNYKYYTMSSKHNDAIADINIERLKQRDRDISNVVNRYMRIKRKSFFRKILRLGIRDN